MFLQPSEVGFLKHLKEARVPVVEFEFPAKRIVNVQSQLEKLIGQNYYLNKVRLFSEDSHEQLADSSPCSPPRTAIDRISRRTHHTVSDQYSTFTSSIWSKLQRALASRHRHEWISRWVQA